MRSFLLAAVTALALIVVGGYWHQKALVLDTDTCPTHLLLGRRDAVNRALKR